MSTFISDLERRRSTQHSSEHLRSIIRQMTKTLEEFGFKDFDFSVDGYRYNLSMQNNQWTLRERTHEGLTYIWNEHDLLVRLIKYTE